MPIQFENNQIKIGNLPHFDEVNLQPIDPQYLKVILINIGIFFVFLLASAIGAFLYWKEDLAAFVYPYFGLLLLLIMVIVSYFLLEFKFRKYALRTHDFIFQHGLIAQTLVFVPICRIQHIELRESWIGKHWGLASISLFTSSSGDEVIVRGLRKEVAEQIKLYIFEQVKKSSEEDIEENNLEENDAN